MFYQISPPCRPKIKKNVSSEPEPSVISLAPFHPLPKIIFENIQVGVTATRQLIIKNPQSFIVNVNVIKCPQVNSDVVTISWNSTEIRACDEVLLEICWTPTESGSWRDSLMISNERSKLKREIFITFRSINKNRPKSPPTKSRRSILKTTTLPKSNKIAISVKKLRKSLSPKVKSFSRPKAPIKPKTNKENECPNMTDQFPFNIPDKKLLGYSLQSNIKKYQPVSIHDDSTFILQNFKQGLEDSLEQNVSTPKIDSFLFTPKREFEAVIDRFQFTPIRTEVETYEIGHRTVIFNQDGNYTERDKFRDDRQFNFGGYQAHVATQNDQSRGSVRKNTLGERNTIDQVKLRRDQNSEAALKNILGENTNTFTETDCVRGANSIGLDHFKWNGNHNSNNTLTDPKNSLNTTYEVTPAPNKLILNNSISPIARGSMMNASITSQNNMSTSTQISNYEFNYSGREARNIIEANLWVDGTFKIPNPEKLSCIYEESRDQSPLKRKLEFSATIPKKMKKIETIKLFNPDLIINKLRNPDPFSAIMTQDPFLSAGLYYDEQWMKRQEIEFTKWLNALLTPHADLACNANIKVDIGKLFTETRNKESKPAPSKEVVSSLYHTNSRLNSLRIKAMTFFEKSEMAVVLSKVLGVIEKKKIMIGKDKNVHLDLVLQAQIMRLLLCYNPLWLRIGLETIYGEIINLRSNTDVVSLSQFIMQRFFADPYLQQKYGIHNVRRAFHPDYAPEIKKFIVKKFVILIYFLDRAKQVKLIPHDPCLFCTNAPVKESRQLLLEFSKHLLAGVGDITKYLRAAEYVLTYKQKYLDEFPYAVKHLGSDLRDGIRLTKVMEIILRKNDLTCLMRAPAISRLQKIYNVGVAMDALKEADFNLQGGIEPKDIVDGHQEKTLSLLWQIIYKFRAPIFIEASLKIQIWWKTSLPVQINRRILLKRRILRETEAAITIQRYYRSYKHTRQVQSQYQKTVASIRLIQMVVRGYIQMKRDRKSYLEYMSAVQIVHRCLRAKLIRKEFIQMRDSVVCLQKHCRGWLLMRETRNWYLNIRSTIVIIQTRYRAYKLGQIIREEYLEIKSTTIKIQRWWRQTRLMLQTRREYLAYINNSNRRTAAIIIYNYWKSYKIRSEYLKLKEATILIQNRVRSFLERNHYLKIKKAAIRIQQQFRANKLRNIQQFEYHQFQKYTVIVQRRYRTILTRRNFLKQKSAAIRIQELIRGFWVRKRYLKLKQATITIQQQFRANKLRNIQQAQYIQFQKYTVIVQRRYRTILARRKYLKQKSAAMKIQQFVRGYLAMKQQRAAYLRIRNAAVLIQNKTRATIQMRMDRKWYQDLRYSAVVVQQRFRATLQMRIDREIYKKRLADIIARELERKRVAVVRIQAIWRGFITRKHQSNQLKLIRQRSVEAATNVRTENTIGSRFINSYDCLFGDHTTCKSLILSLTNIDIITRLCPPVCIPHIAPLVERIFDVMAESNRSDPFYQACTIGSNIILTLSSYHSTKEQFFLLINDHLISILIHSMGCWANKNGSLFPNLCTILWIIIQNDQLKQILCGLPNYETQLSNIYKKVKRMQNMVLNKGGATGPNAKKGSTPRRLNQTINTSISPRPHQTFSDSLSAMTAILRYCNINY